MLNRDLAKNYFEESLIGYQRYNVTGFTPPSNLKLPSLERFKIGKEAATTKTPSNVQLGTSPLQRGAMKQSSDSTANAAGAALGTAMTGAALMGASAAVLGPLAIAAFAVMAISRIQQAKKEKKAIKKAMENERKLQITRNNMFQNRMGLENLAIRNTFLDLERRAMKNRSAFNVSRGESVSGRTYEMLQQELRRNELEMKQRTVSENRQKRIAMREHLVLQYAATRAKMDQLKDSAPSNSDIMMGILGDGVNVAMQYAMASGSTPDAGGTTPDAARFNLEAAPTITGEPYTPILSDGTINQWQLNRF